MTWTTRMLDIVQSSRFRKDLKKIIKQDKDVNKLKQIIHLLQASKPLPKKSYDHNLIGNWNTYRECHITPDWLLIYKIDQILRSVLLARTGSHTELFE